MTDVAPQPDLQELIREVSEGASTPLDQLTSALGVASWFNALGDALVDHFVHQARAAGHSWAEIGTSLGVTRQAAQQRFNEMTKFQQVPLGSDGLREKAAPFVAMRRSDAGDIEVQVENGGAWQGLAAIAGRGLDEWISAARRADSKRWFKRLAEDIDVVSTELGVEIGATVEVALIDGAGRRTDRTVDVTVAKRKAAWRFNRGE